MTPDDYRWPPASITEPWPPRLVLEFHRLLGRSPWLGMHDAPIDADELDEGEYWGCTRPEQPIDVDWMVFDARCARCRIALEAALINSPHLAGRCVDLRWSDHDAVDAPTFTLRQAVELLRLWVHESRSAA